MFFGERGGQVAVFDDEHLAVSLRKDADLFVGRAFRNHLARHLRLLPEVKAEKDRVDGVDEGVVHLEVGDRFDPAIFHHRDGTAPAKGAKRAAMTVGRHRDPVFGFEENFAVWIDSGHPALSKEKHVAFGQSEELVLTKESLGFRVIDVARHNEPRDRSAELRARGLYLFGEYLKQRFLGNRGHGERPLRAVEPEPGALTAGNGERGDLSLAKSFFTDLRGFPPFLLFRFRFGEMEKRSRFEGGKVTAGRVVARASGQPADLREIDFAGVGEQLFTIARRKFVPKSKNLALVRFLEIPVQVGRRGIRRVIMAEACLCSFNHFRCFAIKGGVSLTRR